MSFVFRVCWFFVVKMVYKGNICVMYCFVKWFFIGCWFWFLNGFENSFKINLRLECVDNDK